MGSPSTNWYRQQLLADSAALSPEDSVGDKASNGSGIRDMLSWALARHQALEEDVKMCLGDDLATIETTQRHDCGGISSELGTK